MYLLLSTGVAGQQLLQQPSQQGSSLTGVSSQQQAQHGRAAQHRLQVHVTSTGT